MSFAARAARPLMTTCSLFMLSGGFAVMSDRGRVGPNNARGISNASSARDPRIRPRGAAT